MAMTYGHVYLTKESALRSILHRMERQPDYRPGWSLGGSAGLIQVREHLRDLGDLLEDHRTEGDG